MERVMLNDDGTVTVPDTGQVGLPETLTVELLDAIFACDPGEPGHIAALHARMPPSEKERFADACRAAGYDYTMKWSHAAVAWASVNFDDNRWHLDQMEVCFVEKLGTWLIDEMVATEHGLWYAITPKHGVMSNAEFAFAFGQDFEEHLGNFVAFQTARVAQVVAAMKQPFVHREMQVETADGRLQIVTRRGPANIPVKEWKMRNGEKLVTEL